MMEKRRKKNHILSKKKSKISQFFNQDMKMFLYGKSMECTVKKDEAWLQYNLNNQRYRYDTIVLLIIRSFGEHI